MAETTYSFAIDGDNIKANGYADLRGKILSKNDYFLMVKWDGRTYWVGRGIKGYASPSIAVYQLMESGRYTLAIEHENKRSKKT